MPSVTSMQPVKINFQCPGTPQRRQLSDFIKKEGNEKRIKDTKNKCKIVQDLSTALNNE